MVAVCLVALALAVLLVLLPFTPPPNSIYVAFGQTPGNRDSSKDFDTLSAAGNGSPVGIWSDDTTMWGLRYG